jgi:hypothetical protein
VVEEAVKCELCNSEAHADVQWVGRLPAQTHTFCKAHVDELWERIRAQVGDGMMSFTIMPPGTLASGDREAAATWTYHCPPLEETP